ncbi:MAG: DUF2569 domain-containing protein [Sphingomicrobium sp.]
MLRLAVHHASQRATALRGALEQNLYRLLLAWVVIAGLASALRISFSSVVGTSSGLGFVLPYILLVSAPAISLMLALRWFANGETMPQPSIRLSRLGCWRSVDIAEARRHPLYGANGFMVSLLVGMLVNIPFRAMEYFASMPALAGDVPAWLAVLRVMMTLDLVVMTSLYAIAFAAALRHASIFPRLLLFVWILDMMMQVLTAQLVAAEPGLPAQVGLALGQLLETNVKKLAISVALWLPYLMLSKRVNVTYRLRVPA